MLREGLLEDRVIDVEVIAKAVAIGQKGVAIDVSGAMDAAAVLGDLFKGGSGKRRPEKKRMPISEARPVLEEMESEKIFEDIDVVKTAIATVEESGIVFIDEIDKLVSSSEHRGADASSEGVQRVCSYDLWSHLHHKPVIQDLLPLIEGSVISTKHGNVNTEFILFIASGAFHSSKPSGA
jgi:ATP-dependent HslUV protease ATP-binding subunit HslU